MARGSGNTSSTSRFWTRDWIILVLVGIFLAAVAIRLVYLQVIAAPELSEAADVQHTNSDKVLYARRGTIYDRNGEVLASTVNCKTVYADPGEVTEPEKVAQILEEVLGETYSKSYEDYYELVTKDNRYTYIQRKVDEDLAQTLEDTLDAADVDGIHFEDDVKRVYPYGDVGSQVIGNTNVDNAGISGLEYEYEDVVGGTNGSAVKETGRYSLPVADADIIIEEPTDGSDIVTSIDIKLQQKCEESLLACVQQYEATGGNVTVMDASTGEIYASCSYAKDEASDTDASDGEDATEADSADSADTADDGTAGTYSLEVGKLAAVTDSYEPGSTFKSLTAVAVLTYSDTTPDSYFSVPGSLKVGSHYISDSHDHGTQDMSFTEIIADSSNIGTVLASRTIEESEMYATYTKMGIGTTPTTDFPGTTSGIIADYNDWESVRAANIAFGQGLTVTNAQLLYAYSAIQQGGTAHMPHFLVDVPDDGAKTEELTSEFADGTKMADKTVCEDVCGMLEEVVVDGTGEDAAIEGFSVAGKTGTAEIAENGSYGAGYNVSFIGWLEGSSSDLMCIVTVNKPHSDAGGGGVCGPVFADIMSFAIERYKIAPEAG